MSKLTSVFVVDDNAIMRLGLTETISIEPDLELAGSASSAEDALDQFLKSPPDVVTMDYQMPGMNGIECTKKIIELYPDAKVILLSVFDSEEDIWKAKQAGVRGYLTKKAGEIEDVIEAIQEVSAGGNYFPSSIAQKLARRQKLKSLTEREMTVLRLLAEGLSNKEIENELGISLPMVKLHVVNLREKLGAVDRTQAVVQALKRGIIHLED